nr:hypothetical protein [Tanacetum cinerariifolium]
MPPSPNHVFDFPTHDPSSSDESDVESEEDHQEEPIEVPEEDPHKEPEEEPEEDLQEGSPYPPPPASPDVEPEMNIAGHVPRAIREATHVENIRLRRELEDVEIRYTFMRMGKERDERDLRKMTDWAHGFYEGMLRIGAIGDKPSEAIDVLVVYEESQPPGSHGPPSGLYVSNHISFFYPN